MDVRDSTNPVVLGVGRWLATANARHPWNHNEHFHGWILRNLPAERHTAIDIGCGTGVLARKLAAHFARVTAIDADEGMAAAANTHLAGTPRVSIVQCSLDAFAATADYAEADLITMVAVLHHLDLADTLSRIPPPAGTRRPAARRRSCQTRHTDRHDDRPALGSGKSAHGPDQTPPSSAPD